MGAETGTFKITKHNGRCHAVPPVITIVHLESGEVHTQFPDGESATVSAKNNGDESKYWKLLAFLREVIKNPPRGFEVRQM